MNKEKKYHVYHFTFLKVTSGMCFHFNSTCGYFDEKDHITKKALAKVANGCGLKDSEYVVYNTFYMGYMSKQEAEE